MPRVLVCAGCQAGLEILGATREPAEITLGHQCETHVRKERAQAQHAMVATDAALIEWRGMMAAAIESIPDDERGPHIAELAGHLLAGNMNATEEDVSSAVALARRIWRASKGG